VCRRDGKLIVSQTIKQVITHYRVDIAGLYTVTLATLLGGFVRLAPVLASDFPLNDGGLFYTMIQDLKKAHFHLPLYTSYNSANIPFAYPPLPFYVAAWLSDLAGWSALDVVRLLPAIISILTIPAFYLVCKPFLGSGFRIALATMAFALLPRSFEWLIMGGGLTRSFGLLFAILALQQAYLFYTKAKSLNAFLLIIFSSLTVLSHPETSWFAAYSILLLFLFFGWNTKNFIKSGAIVLGVLVLTSPWWLTILQNHGISPIISASRTGMQSWWFWVPILRFDITDEPFSTLLAVMGLLGVFANLTQKKAFLPVWLLTTFMLTPRSGAIYAMIPLAILIAIGISQVVLPGISLQTLQSNPKLTYITPIRNEFDLLNNKSSKIIIGYFLVFSLISAYLAPAAEKSPIHILSKEEQDAMEWIKNNTPAKSTFVIIPSGDAWSDVSSEWFPAMTGQKSLTTVQGSEWLNNATFYQTWRQYRELSDCSKEDVECISSWSQINDIPIEYLYISTSVDLLALQKSLVASSEYYLVYDGIGAKLLYHHETSK